MNSLSYTGFNEEPSVWHAGMILMIVSKYPLVISIISAVLTERCIHLFVDIKLDIKTIEMQLLLSLHVRGRWMIGRRQYS